MKRNKKVFWNGHYINQDIAHLINIIILYNEVDFPIVNETKMKEVEEALLHASEAYQKDSILSYDRGMRVAKTKSELLKLNMGDMTFKANDDVLLVEHSSSYLVLYILEEFELDIDDNDISWLPIYFFTHPGLDVIWNESISLQ